MKKKSFMNALLVLMVLIVPNIIFVACGSGGSFGRILLTADTISWSSNGRVSENDGFEINLYNHIGNDNFVFFYGMILSFDEANPRYAPGMFGSTTYFSASVNHLGLEYGVWRVRIREIINGGDAEVNWSTAVVSILMNSDIPMTSPLNIRQNGTWIYWDTPLPDTASFRQNNINIPNHRLARGYHTYIISIISERTRANLDNTSLATLIGSNYRVFPSGIISWNPHILTARPQRINLATINTHYRNRIPNDNSIAYLIIMTTRATFDFVHFEPSLWSEPFRLDISHFYNPNR